MYKILYDRIIVLFSNIFYGKQQILSFIFILSIKNPNAITQIHNVNIFFFIVNFCCV